MSDFIKQRTIQAAEQGVARAKALIDMGEHDQAAAVCNQVLARDHQAPGPSILGMQIAAACGDFDTAIKQAEQALRTRPRFEDGEFSCGLDLTYADVADQIDDICRMFNALLAQQVGESVETFAVPGLIRFRQGLADHVRGRLGEAREHYLAVLTDPVGAHYLIGPVLNLLAALEQQRGTPENAFRWIDRETYPLELQPLGDVGGTEVESFNDGLFEEVMASPKLTYWEESQSEQWFIAPELNDETAGPYVKQLEQVFLRNAEENLAAFRDTSPVPDHATFGQAPDDYDVEMFSAVLKGPGHVGPHVHSDAFLVGNYYVRVPEEPADAPDGAGCIEYGKHVYHAATGTDYQRRRFNPKAGTMLMWPSYFSHGTIPSTAPGVRMVVGFDLVPKGATGTYGKIERG